MTLLKSPLRVLHVLGSGQIGGIERVVYDLCAEQSSTGDVAPSVLFTRGGGPFAEAVRALGIDVTDLNAFTGFGCHPRVLRQVLRIARDNDLVHVHGFSPFLAMTLVRSRRPIVFHEHGVFGQGRKPGVRDRIKRRMKGRFLRNRVAATVANSHFTSDWATRLYRLAKCRPSVVYNGISPHRFSSGGNSTRQGGFSEAEPLLVGSVGRLVRFKAFDRLLRAAALIKDEQYRVLIVGDGPDRDALLDTARELGIVSRVDFVGSTTDVPSYLRNIDLFVLPSIEEPFGLVLVEALAAGLPAVVFADSGGPAEILSRLRCGQVVSSETELAEVIRAAIELRAFPSMCTLDEVEREFGITVMARRLLSLYRDIVSGGEPNRAQ